MHSLINWKTTNIWASHKKGKLILLLLSSDSWLLLWRSCSTWQWVMQLLTRAQKWQSQSSLSVNTLHMPINYKHLVCNSLNTASIKKPDVGSHTYVCMKLVMTSLSLCIANNPYRHVVCYEHRQLRVTYLLQGRTHNPQHFSMPVRFFSASRMSALIWSIPSSMRSNCSEDRQLSVVSSGVQDKVSTVFSWTYCVTLCIVFQFLILQFRIDQIHANSKLLYFLLKI